MPLFARKALRLRGKERWSNYRSAMPRKRRHQQIFVRAVEAQLDGRLAEAARQLRRLLRDKPRDHEAVHQLGLVRWQQAELDEALELLESSAAMAPTEGRYQANLGNLYQSTGNTRGALAALQRSVALQPENAAVWSSLGVALRAGGRLDESVSALRQATSLDAGNAPALQNLGSALEQLGDLAGAAAALEQAAELQPSDPEIWTALGKVSERRAALPQAESLYRRALLCDRQHGPAWSNLGGLLCRRGSLEAAIDACERAIAADPSLADAYTHFGLALREQGHAGPAAATWQRGLQVRATPEALLNLSDVLDELGQAEPSAGALEELLERFPDFVAGWLAHGRRLLVAGDRAAAVEALEHALSLDPESEEARHFLRAAAGDAQGRAPVAYVRDLFEEYAGRFEQHLTGTLAYQTPSVLVSLLGPEPLDTVVDLGCGTGLVGPLVRSRCRRLVGVDLSPKMLARARAKAVYDDLIAGDVGDVLRRLGPVDVAIAADVFIYFGDLAPVFDACDAAQLLFSVEAHAGPEDWVLRSTGRYAHSTAYVQRLASAAGYVVEATESSRLRKERGDWVEGTLCRLRRISRET